MGECALYSEPGLYDSLFPSAREGAAQRFYIEEAKRGGGRVLELGCGTGRLTVLAAQNGVDITGADLSERMLEFARSKAIAAGVSVPFVQADMRRFDLPGPFSAVLIPGNSLLHLLTNDELKDCLACVARHLAPGGRMIFDISKWDLARLARDPGHRYEVMRFEHPERGEVTIEESSTYDSALQIRDIKWYLTATGAADFRAIEYRLRVIFPQELPLLLDLAGFILEARFGEFKREPFQASSRRQVCVGARGGGH